MRLWLDRVEKVAATWAGVRLVGCNTYLKKGSGVLVTGRLQQDKTTGGPRVFQRADGTSGASFEITAETVRFLSSGQGSNGAETREVEAEEEATIPF